MGHFSCGIGNRLHNRLYFYHAEDDALKYDQGIEHDDPFVVIRAPKGLFTQIIVVQTPT